MTNYANVAKEVERRMDGYNVEVVSIPKNNGIMLNGFCIKKDNEALVPNIYVDDIEDQDDEKIVEVVIERYRRQADQQDAYKAKFDPSKIADPDFILKNVIPTLVNGEMNKKSFDMRGVVYKPFLDMAIAYRVVIDNEDGHMSSYLLKYDILENAGLAATEVHTQAMKNISQSMKIQNICDILWMPDMFPTKMLVVTNDNKCNGASGILLDSVMNELHEQLGEKIVIIPSSIHEVIAIPASDGMEGAMLVDMIRSVNANEVSDTEVLSDNAYCHSVEEGWVIVNEESKIATA